MFGAVSVIQCEGAKVIIGYLVTFNFAIRSKENNTDKNHFAHIRDHLQFMYQVAHVVLNELQR